MIDEFTCDQCGNEWLQSFSLTDWPTCPECGARWESGAECGIDIQPHVTEWPNESVLSLSSHDTSPDPPTVRDRSAGRKSQTNEPLEMEQVKWQAN